MLTFFRRIRKGLLEGGRTSKYLLYAIGEIALVVFGILIALQINNWNEEQKAQRYEYKLLGELLNNLSFDIEHNTRKIENNKSTKASCEIIVHHLTENLPFHDSLEYHFANAHNWNIAIIRDNAYQNAKTYGLDFISDDTIKRELSWTYEANIDFLDELGDRQNLFYYNVVVPTLSELFDSSHPKRWADPLSTASYKMVPLDYTKLKSDHKYLHILRSTIQIQDKYYFHYNNLCQRMLRLSEGLKKEIEFRSHWQ